MKLTDRQIEVAEIIEQYDQRHGYAPSVRDIAVQLGISPNGVQHHLEALERKGAISRRPGMARSLRVSRPMA